MSQARVEFVLRGYEAMNRGDMEAAFDGLAPDFELIPPGIVPEAEVQHGPEAAIRFWTTWRETFDDFHFEIEEAIDAGDHVIVMAAVCGRVKTVDVEVRTPSFPLIWTFEGDRLVRMEALQNRALALEKVGLSE